MIPISTIYNSLTVITQSQLRDYRHLVIKWHNAIYSITKRDSEKMDYYRKLIDEADALEYFLICYYIASDAMKPAIEEKINFLKSRESSI